VFTLSEPPLFTRLRTAHRILIAGAGGGFDVYAGIPLALALSPQRKHNVRRTGDHHFGSSDVAWARG
jgi:hypothetical protein